MGMYDSWGRPTIPEGYKLVKDPDYQRNAMMSYLGQATGPGRIPARFVSSPEEIRPNEVPSDGTLALFPRMDYQEIYARQLNRNNIIDEVTYVPKRSFQQEQPAQNAVVPQTVDFGPVNERLEKIESTLAGLKNLWETPQSTQTAQNEEK